MPLMETSGNVTADAYAGGVAVKTKYIEDYFQTWLRTGTGASATVTTGLDASTNKALVWTKSRSAATDHKLTDTVRGATKALISDTTGAQTTDTNGLTAFSATGYTIGSDTNYNNSGATYVDWEFVATPKFFDVVTWTGNGTGNRAITHNLGSVPGCIILKVTNGTDEWYVYHRGLNGGVNPQNAAINLNRTYAESVDPSYWNNTAPTSTQFTVGSAIGNGSGLTYVAYLFAHNAGGFGLTGTDNVISCGSFTCDSGGNATVNLGYEPQWVLYKPSSSGGTWELYDVMRGYSQTQDNGLQPNSSAAEFVNTGNLSFPTATGFTLANGAGLAGATFIYIAIRRGPMKVPTDATKVFSPTTYTGNGTTRVIDSGITQDLAWVRNRNTNTETVMVADRLRGNPFLQTSSTTSESSGAAYFPTDVFSSQQTGVKVGTSSATNGNTKLMVVESLARAPSFFDVVCYTGNGYNPINHNLGVAPELVIQKSRSGVGAWYVTVFPANSYGLLQRTDAFSAAGQTQPTSTQFWPDIGASGVTYVAYLFATCAGVSKVGSYTGNGSTQTINCGFTGGARFVLLKATSTTGGWYLYDTARGMTTLIDPYFQLNSATVETATLGSVTTVTTGFALDETITTGVNTNAVSYIFLAIA